MQYFSAWMIKLANTIFSLQSCHPIDFSVDIMPSKLFAIERRDTCGNREKMWRLGDITFVVGS